MEVKKGSEKKDFGRKLEIFTEYNGVVKISLEEYEDRLNTLAREYFALKTSHTDTPADSAVIMSQNMKKAWLSFYCPRFIEQTLKSKEISQTELEVWATKATERLIDSFNPAMGEGNFVHYIRKTWSKQSITLKDNQGHTDSIDKIIEAANDPDVAPSISRDKKDAERDKKHGAIDEQLAIAEATLQPVLKMAGMILQYRKSSNRYSGIRKTKKWIYYGLEYTAIMTLAIKSSDYDFWQADEMFAAMDQDFLHSYMDGSCKNLRELCETPLKWYGTVVEEQPMSKRVPLPIPLDVYVAYSKKHPELGLGDSLATFSDWKRKFMQTWCLML